MNILAITADANDANYVTKVEKISSKQLERFQPVFEAIKNFKPYEGGTRASGDPWLHFHNWPQGEYAPRTDLGEKSVEEIYADVLSPELIENFNEFVPYGESGIHSIVEIRCYKVSKTTTYYDKYKGIS